MKTILNRMARMAVLITAVILSACGSAPEKMTWSMETMAVPAGLIPGDSISVSYPVAAGTPAADSVNLRIGKVLGLLASYDEETFAGVPLSARIDTLLRERNRDSLIHEMPYQILVGGEVNHYGNVASVAITAYVFIGGAHGLGTETLLNFDSRTGREVSVLELVADTVRLSDLNKIAFSEHFGDDLAELPLFVTSETLPLPQNIGIDSAGLRMHYNPYEIGPYYLGPTDYLLPMDEVKPLLNPAVIE